MTTEIQNKDKEITEIQNKLTAAEAKAKTESEAATAKLKDVQDKLDAMETDKKAAEEAAAKLNAETMVEGHAVAGRIKNEATVKLEWVKMAIENFDRTKTMLEALPLNKTSAVIVPPVANKLEAGELPTTAAALSAKNKLKREGRL